MSLFLSPALSLFMGLWLEPPTEPSSAPPPAESQGSLREPTWVSHDSPEGKLWIEGTTRVLAERLSAFDRRRLGTKVLSTSRVSLAKGTFPNGGKVLVTVNVGLRTSDPQAEPQTIAGMFTLGADGGLASMVIDPRMRPSRMEVQGIGNLDGDGMDDFEYEETTPETIVRHRVTWPGGQPRDETISTVPAPSPPTPAE